MKALDRALKRTTEIAPKRLSHLREYLTKHLRECSFGGRGVGAIPYRGLFKSYLEIHLK